jgi:hypothetical protein
LLEISDQIAGLFHADAEPHQTISVRRGTARVIQIVSDGQICRPRPAITSFKQFECIDKGAFLSIAQSLAKDEGKQTTGSRKIALSQFVSGAAFKRRVQHGLHFGLRG